MTHRQRTIESRVEFQVLKSSKKESHPIKNAVLVLLFTLFWIVTAWLASAVAIRVIPGKYFMAGSWERRLIDYERALTDYSFLRSGECDGVIIGTSYARGLGEFEGVYNLGFGGTRADDHLRIIRRYCRKQDKVIYVITMREVTMPEWDAPRHALTSAFVRYPTVAKAAVLDLLNLRDPVDMSSVYENFDPDSIEYKLICESTRYEDLPGLKRPKQVTGTIRFLARASSFSLEPLYAIKEEHPNIIFVLSPILPLQAVEGDSRLAEEINAFVSNQQKFEIAMEESGLPVLNLSQAAPATAFTDLIHYHQSEESLKAVRKELIRILSDDSP
jgi:hypothetical protein